MKLRREARTLKKKSISSLRIGLEAFNSFSEDGRVTTVLLHLQHACEMFLKAALTQQKINIVDPDKGHAVGFKKCLNLAKEHCRFSESQTGTFRAIDMLRDAEQHWFIVVPEDTLYLHARALVTAFDELLDTIFQEKLAAHLPTRVLPVSTMPEADFQVMIDRECKLIKSLLAPGRRAKDDARGRIHTLLAMEGHVKENAEISNRDIQRVEKAIKDGKGWREIFAPLVQVSTNIVGTTVDIKVHFTKKQGIAVHRAGADDVDTAAVREVDLQEKFRYTRAEVAKRLKLTSMQAKKLREHLGIDGNSDLCHVFGFGSQKHPCFSDQALAAMKEALKNDNVKSKISEVPRRKPSALTQSDDSQRV